MYTDAARPANVLVYQNMNKGWTKFRSLAVRKEHDVRAQPVHKLHRVNFVGDQKPGKLQLRDHIEGA